MSCVEKFAGVEHWWKKVVRGLPERISCMTLGLQMLQSSTITMAVLGLKGAARDLEREEAEKVGDTNG